MAELLFREDPYLRSCEATVVALHGHGAHGQDLLGLAPYQIVRKGIARTFQLCRPFVGMTVLERWTGTVSPLRVEIVVTVEGKASNSARLLVQ